MKKIFSFSILIPFLIGLFFGAVLTIATLWHQVENRYKMGQNNGYLEGSFDMAAILMEK